MIGPEASAMARLTVATSSPSDVNGSCTAVTEGPFAARSGITFAQLDPSAQAPCTRITSDDFAISSLPQCVRLPRLGTAWPRRVPIFNTRTHVSIAAYSAIRGTPTELDKAVTWRGGFSRNQKHLLTAMHAVAEKVTSTTWRDELPSA